MTTVKLLYSLAVIFISSFILILIISCNSINASESKKNSSYSNKSNNRKVSERLKKYWFDGNAEISSYKLNQARYGEIHEGTATLIFVTEPFSKKSNTKADYKNDTNVSVLKLNTTKKFTTGIYPYSMMNSTFFPFENSNTSLKITSSVQEWCGMTYVEMKNKENLIFNLNSYFEGASFKGKTINKTLLEDDLWSYIRLNPESLPIGKQTIIPSMFYLNSMHKDFKPYKATTSLKATTNNKYNIYKIEYPSLQRTLNIKFSTDFPYKIISWEESYSSGYDKNKKTLTTQAELLASVKIDYWNKNKKSDTNLRRNLKLQE